MEPVPETEKMEEFSTTPLPSLRLQNLSQFDTALNPHGESPLRPNNLRRSTDPSSPSYRSPGWSSPILPFRPSSRNTSPFPRGHTRSKSSQSALAQPMARAQSLPGVYTSSPLYVTPQRPASPRGSPHRQLRKPVDEAFPAFSSPAHSPHQRALSLGSISDISETIPEDEEATLHPRDRSNSPVMGNSSHSSHALPKIRRPASPLRNSSVQGGLAPNPPASLTSSPSFHATRFSESAISGIPNYNWGSTYSYASSSVPSTPTSLRSRSPSISSLETIPDTPDAEEAAIEAYRIAQLKAAADEAEGDEAAMELKRKEEAGASRGRTLGPTYGARDKRKRWSVCGAERRGDLDLETIWED